MKTNKTNIKGANNMHYSTTLSLVISNIVIFGLASLFSQTLLGEPLGHFAYLAELTSMQRASAARSIVGSGEGGGALIAPSNLTVTDHSLSSISLAWRDNSADEAGFKLERLSASPTSTPADWRVVADVQSTATSTPDTTRLVDYRDTFLNGLMQKKTYKYRVRAYISSGFSNYSNEASGTTQTRPGDTTGPSVPVISNIGASTCRQVIIAWNRSVDTGGSVVFGYNIYRNGNRVGFVYRPFNDPATLTFTDSGVAASTSYMYTIQAFDDIFNASALSIGAAVTTPACETIPNAPSGLSVRTFSPSQLDLLWNDTSTNETGFKVERASSSPSFFNQIAIVGPSTTDSLHGSFKDAGLSASTTYFYRVRAFNIIGNSGYSNTASGTTFRSP